MILLPVIIIWWKNCALGSLRKFKIKESKKYCCFHWHINLLLETKLKLINACLKIFFGLLLFFKNKFARLSKVRKEQMESTSSDHFGANTALISGVGGSEMKQDPYRYEVSALMQSRDLNGWWNTKKGHCYKQLSLTNFRKLRWDDNYKHITFIKTDYPNALIFCLWRIKIRLASHKRILAVSQCRFSDVS